MAKTEQNCSGCTRLRAATLTNRCWPIIGYLYHFAQREQAMTDKRDTGTFKNMRQVALDRSRHRLVREISKTGPGGLIRETFHLHPPGASIDM